MTFEVRSKSGRLVRLTEMVWEKITSEHPEFKDRNDYLTEVARTIEDPDYIVQGWTAERLALRWCESAPRAPKYLCPVYRELNGVGFVITAFFISRHERVLRRPVLWQKER